VGSLLHSTSIQSWLAIAGLPLSLMTAIYTAYLFAQAKARDLWQSSLLPPHLFVQALLLGSVMLLPFAWWLEPAAMLRASRVSPLIWILAVTSLLHILMTLGETSLTHATAHARLAAWEMTRGRFRDCFLVGMCLSAAGGLLPWLVLIASFLGSTTAIPLAGPLGAVPAAIGLLLFEHAYVQAGQSVPLA